MLSGLSIISLKPIWGNILFVFNLRLKIEPFIKPIPFIFPFSVPSLAKSCIPKQIPKIFPLLLKIFSLIGSISFNLFNLFIASLNEPTPGRINISLFFIIFGSSDKELSCPKKLIAFLTDNILPIP